MTDTAGTAIAVLAEHLAGFPAGIAVQLAGAAAGPQVPAAPNGRNAGHTWAAR